MITHILKKEFSPGGGQGCLEVGLRRSRAPEGHISLSQRPRRRSSGRGRAQGPPGAVARLHGQRAGSVAGTLGLALLAEAASHSRSGRYFQGLYGGIGGFFEVSGTNCCQRRLQICAAPFASELLGCLIFSYGCCRAKRDFFLTCELRAFGFDVAT